MKIKTVDEVVGRIMGRINATLPYVHPNEMILIKMILAEELKDTLVAGETKL